MQTSHYYAAKAKLCRGLASEVPPQEASVLTRMAARFERLAALASDVGVDALASAGGRTSSRF